ncbi:MAG: VanZ family protein [Oscillospiraceae bacterium]|nr:VanZ family protein [Oscillospiraceae bacterium]
MTEISFLSVQIFITAIWIIARAAVCIKKQKFDFRRELQLLLVYICIMVIARMTFFPFAKIEGKVQPLLLDSHRIFPPRINLVPFVNLFSYENLRDALLNLIGNTAMFIPVGIIWPAVFKKLDSHKKVIASGFCFSLIIELLQLLFFDRVSDIDDLFLNTFGFAIGYGIFLLCKKISASK